MLYCNTFVNPPFISRYTHSLTHKYRSCPCLRCTVKIIQTGVKEVVYNLSYKVYVLYACRYLRTMLTFYRTQGRRVHGFVQRGWRSPAEARPTPMRGSMEFLSFLRLYHSLRFHSL